MAGYFDAGGGGEEALFEGKSLGTKARCEDVALHLSHLHPLPVLPPGPAGVLVELIIPLGVVQGVAPQLGILPNFPLGTLHIYSLLVPALLVQT